VTMNIETGGSFEMSGQTYYATCCNNSQHRSLSSIRVLSNPFNSSSWYPEFWGRKFI